MTRRTLLHSLPGLASFGGTAAKDVLAIHDLPREIRRPAEDPEYPWAVLTRAFRSLPADDPKDAASLAGQAQLFLSANRHHHGSAFFLWNRWYLHFLERLLSRAAGQIVTLPYWEGSLDPALPMPAKLAKSKGVAGTAGQAHAVWGNVRAAATPDECFTAIGAWRNQVLACASKRNARALIPCFFTQIDRLFEWWGPADRMSDPGLSFTFYDFPPGAGSHAVTVRAIDALQLPRLYHRLTPNLLPGALIPRTVSLGDADRTRTFPTLTLEIHMRPKRLAGPYVIRMISPTRQLEIGVLDSCMLQDEPMMAVFRLPTLDRHHYNGMSVQLEPSPQSNLPPLKLTRQQFRVVPRMEIQ